MSSTANQTKSPPSVDVRWIVADLLIEWPQTIPIFLRHRMNCVGCSMAAFETLGDALHIYGLPQAPFLAEVNAVISAASPAAAQG
jgi:hybrid cluster-associated redox disulfide protein